MDDFSRLDYKGSEFDNDCMLSTPATDPTSHEISLNGFEMNDTNLFNASKQSENTRMFLTSPPHSSELPSSINLDARDNSVINFLEDNILQDPNDDERAFEQVGTSFEMSQSSYNLPLNPLHEQFINQRLHDEFEASLHNDEMDYTFVEESINTCDPMVDNNMTQESLNTTDDQAIDFQINTPVKDDKTNLLKKMTDFKILIPTIPKAIWREYNEQKARKRRDNQENQRVKDEKKVKKHKEKEHRRSERRTGIVESSSFGDASSYSPPSDTRGQLKLKKPRLQRVRTCVTCSKDIYSTADLFDERSLYCTIECLTAMVDRCKQICKPTEKINFMDEAGTLIQLPMADTINIYNLKEFLMKDPGVKPFVDFAKLEEVEAPSKFLDLEQGLKKEDAIRAKVKVNICEQLMTRAKTSKVGVSRKATKELSDQIEIELYRIHKSAKAVKYKQWFADFVTQITNDKNIFFKSVVTNVFTPQKLVIMTKDQMYISPEDNDATNNTAGATSSTVRKPIRPSPRKPNALSAVDKILGEEGADTTLKHNSHEFDSNCRICAAKAAERRAALEQSLKDREEEMEDRKRRKELGAKNKRREPSPKPRSRWNSSAYHRSPQRSPIRSPRRSPVRRRYSFDADDDFAADEPLGNFDIPGPSAPLGRPESPQRLIHTPPPGVSPDRLAVRTISPQSSGFDSSLRDAGFNRSASSSQIQPHSPPITLRDVYAGPRMLPPRPQLWSHGMPPPRFPADLRGFPRPIPRQFFPPEAPVTWSPGMPVPRMTPNVPQRFPGASRHGFEPDDSWRREEQWRSFNRPEFFAPKSERSTSPVLLRPSPTSPVEQQPFSPTFHERPAPELPPPQLNPWIGKDLTMWKGRIKGEGFDFRSSLQLISNPHGFDLIGKLPEVIPIKARVKPQPMWEFIQSLRGHDKFQIIIAILLKDPTDPPSEKKYNSCFNELKSCERFGVVDLPKEELGIKETYMFLLEPSEPLPKVLLPIKGPGVPDAQQHEKILAMIIVKYKHKKPKEPQTLEEMLEVIEKTDTPGEFVKIVKAFLTRPNITPEEKEILKNRCDAKIRKQKGENAPPVQIVKAEVNFEPPSSNNEVEEVVAENKEAKDEPMEVDEPEVKDERKLQIKEEPESRVQSTIEEVPPPATRIPQQFVDSEDEPQLQIDEARDEDENVSLKKENNDDDARSAPESGEMRSDIADDDMDISDDESSKIQMLVPPPPPPPTQEMLNSVIPPPPPPPAMFTSHMAPPPAPSIFFPSHETSVEFSHAHPNNMENGNFNNAISSPGMFRGSDRGRGKKKNNRGGRGNFNNAHPLMPRQPPPNFMHHNGLESQGRPEWRRSMLPPQEEMFMQHSNFGRPPFPRGPPSFYNQRLPPRGFPRGVPPRFMRGGPPRNNMY